MPAPIYRGDFPVLVSESTKYFDRGKIELTKVYVYKAGNVTTGSIGQFLSYDNKRLSLTNILLNTQDGLTQVTHTYTGGSNTAPEVYEVVAAVQEEPISSHPAFTSALSGSLFTTSIVQAAGTGNVNFDDEDIFLSFGKDAENNFFGVQSYLSPQVSYRRIYSLGAVPSAGLTSQIAYIFNTPSGEPPTLASGRNWLQTSVNIKNNGNFRTESGQWEVIEEYRASGLNAWNNSIYFTAS
jgi:hypothetical protein